MCAFANRAGSTGRRRGESGQALVEMAITIVMLVTMSLGIVEFGRAFMVASMITQAARDAARTAALQPPSNRNSSGIITSNTPITSVIQTNLNGLLASGTVSSLVSGTSVTQPTVGGTPMVTVTVTGTVPYIFQLWGATFAVNRSVTFRDEGR